MAPDAATHDHDAGTVDMDALDADERRAYRARTENMVVVPQTTPEGEATGLYDVYSQSGSEYMVDVDRDRGCTCPDAEYNDGGDRCKHRRRVAIAISETACPAPGEPLGDYEDTLADIRRSLEQERAAILGDLETLNGLLDPFDSAEA